MSSLAEMRKEIKELRKKANPVPVSRMKKSECAAELERLRGKEEKAVEKVLAEEKVPKKTAKKVEAVQKKEHAKQDKAEEEPVKKTKGVKAKEAESKVKVPTTLDPLPKKESKAGSEEMKAKMAALRAMRKKKD